MEDKEKEKKKKEEAERKRIIQLSKKEAERKKKEKEEKEEIEEEEEKEKEEEEEKKESELGGSWKTIPAVSSSSASGQESERRPSVAFEPSELQVSHRINPGGGAFQAKEEMLGRKPPSGARTAPLPR